MKTKLLLFSILLCVVFQVQEAQSKDKNETHNFKIVGKTELTNFQGYKVVEYDSLSMDHLYVTTYTNKGGRIISKKQYLFKGDKFDLSKSYQVYIDRKEILIDGVYTFYKEDGSLLKTLHYLNGELLFQNLYYPNGQKQAMLSGANKLNGAFKTWYPGGQLSFSGNYKDSLKNGDFEQFSETGTSLKKGFYKEGKHISGDIVVPDIVYTTPEVPAKYPNGDEALDQYFKKKSAEINFLKNIPWGRFIELQLNVDKKGKITDIHTPGSTDSLDLEIVKAVLNPLPEFSPAQEENIPVDSELKLSLLLTPEQVRLQLKDQDKDSTKNLEMPQFPGGESAIRKLITKNLSYPAFALKNGIQGKVFVYFVVQEDGSIGNIAISKSVHPTLDGEAVRVIKNMPKWIPGTKDGKAVKVAYIVPINFVL